jgi:hypothetical protein
VLGQQREAPGDLRLRSRDDRRPAAASPWRPWLKRLSLRTKPLHRLDLPFFPHSRRHPSWAGLPTAGEPVDLATRFLGQHLFVPPLSPGAHGGQRPFLAFVSEGPVLRPPWNRHRCFPGTGHFLQKP